MNLFNKDMVEKKINKWFKVENDFVIENESQVIFGFNGIGKSTLFNIIKEKSGDLIEYFNYDSNDFKKIVNENTIQVNVHINKIIDLESNIKDIYNTLKINDSLKANVGIKVKADFNKINNSKINELYSKDFDYFRLEKQELENVQKNLNNFPINVFYELQNELKDLCNVEKEIRNHTEYIHYNALKHIYDILDDSNICPICDSNKEDLKMHLKEKMSKLSKVHSNIIDKFKIYGIEPKLEILNSIKSGFEIIKDEFKQRDFFVCLGSIARYDEIKSSCNKVRSNIDKINKLEKKAKNIYNNIKQNEENFKYDLCKYFDVKADDILFDDCNNKIEITFPRKISSYSTGQINLIFFLSKIYSFLGSDKKVFLLDDPVSSLDLINHYKIAYEICKNASNKSSGEKKNIIIFTHSVDLINILNSQESNLFKYYYLEQLDGMLTKNEINISSPHNIISLTNFEDLNIDFSNNFIKALIEKDKVSSDNSIHRTFHYYKEEYKYKNDESDNNFSNHKLIEIIENHKSFANTNFKVNSYYKMLILTALRVWLEKKLYDLLDSDDLRTKYLKINTLGTKIDLIEKHRKILNISDKIRKDLLMSKKVMLNQAVHSHSQILPLSYAINLSFDQIQLEIDEFKSMF